MSARRIPAPPPPTMGEIDEVFDQLLRGAVPVVETVVRCLHCEQRNRLNTKKKNPRCGKCGLPLER